MALSLKPHEREDKSERSHRILIYIGSRDLMRRAKWAIAYNRHKSLSRLIRRWLTVYVTETENRAQERERMRDLPSSELAELARAPGAEGASARDEIKRRGIEAAVLYRGNRGRRA